MHWSAHCCVYETQANQESTALTPKKALMVVFIGAFSRQKLGKQGMGFYHAICSSARALQKADYICRLFRPTGAYHSYHLFELQGIGENENKKELKLE